MLRHVVVGGVSLLATGVVGAELINHGVLPGKLTLDELTGACDVSSLPAKFGPLGPTRSSSFVSRFRRRRVGYTVAWPHGHGPGSVLPLVVTLHGFGGNHFGTTVSMSPAQAVSLLIDGRQLAKVGIVTVDGGGGYWHPHPNDDPMGMVIHELIPLCQSLGLGASSRGIGVCGISMGGYGALILAEYYPHLFRAVAAISPAIWTSYDEAKSANAGAYSDRAEFDRYDAVTHTAALRGLPIRIASGNADVFHDGVVALTNRLPASAEIVFGNGCHTRPFFAEQEPPTMSFLAQHLAN